MEPFLAFFHYLMIFATVSLVVAEFLVLGLTLTAELVKLLGQIDLGYGALVVLVVASGLARVFWGDVPSQHWAAEPAFWSKMALFGVVGALSIVPTVRYLKWGKAAATGELPSDPVRRQTRLLVLGELVVLAVLPLLAVVMASSAEA